jgi:hypothetical protein
VEFFSIGVLQHSPGVLFDLEPFEDYGRAMESGS